MNDRIAISCGVKIQLNSGNPAEPRKEVPGLQRLKELARELGRRNERAGRPSSEQK